MTFLSDVCFLNIVLIAYLQAAHINLEVKSAQLPVLILFTSYRGCPDLSATIVTVDCDFFLPLSLARARRRVQDTPESASCLHVSVTEGVMERHLARGQMASYVMSRL